MMMMIWIGRNYHDSSEDRLLENLPKHLHQSDESKDPLCSSV